MRSLRRYASLPALAVVVVAAAGCPSIPGECRDNVDCGAGLVCRAVDDVNTCIPRQPDPVDGGPNQDAGPLLDTGPAPEDAGPVETDAGPSETDAGPDEAEDAGASDDDAGPDAG